MKKLLIIIFLIELCAFLSFNYKLNNFSNKDQNITIINQYTKNITYNFVSNIDNNIISNKQDLLNLFYTSLNNGLDSFSFECTYNCNNDIISTLNDKNKLYAINNLVSPYNSYQDFELSFKDNKFIIKFNKTYTSDDTLLLNYQIDNVLASLINDKMTNEEKLIILHNYLINNITYDNSFKESSKATGALLYGKAICSGYADAIAIILDKLDIPNYRVVSDTHVWNAVYINNKWLHIDLTYDDPLIQSNNISYNYFLVDSSYLNDQVHNYNRSIYKDLI